MVKSETEPRCSALQFPTARLTDNSPANHSTPYLKLQAQDTQDIQSAWLLKSNLKLWNLINSYPSDSPLCLKSFSLVKISRSKNVVQPSKPLPAKLWEWASKSHQEPERLQVRWLSLARIFHIDWGVRTLRDHLWRLLAVKISNKCKSDTCIISKILQKKLWWKV